MLLHLNRLTYMLIANSDEKMIRAFTPVFFLSSCSGSAAQWRKVTTSFAIWEAVAGVPVGSTLFNYTVKIIEKCLPSLYSTNPSKSTRAMEIAPPGKYGL